MPTLQQIYILDVTPEKFIDNCSDVELQEIILLANAKLSRHETSAPAQAYAKKLPAPMRQVAVKALPKGHTPKQSVRKRPFWTPEEDAILRKMWPSASGVDIAKRLNLEYKTVMTHASKLGLRKRGSPKRTGDARQEPEPTPEAEDITTPATPEPKPKKKMISVRVDKRTIVQVPEGTDIEELKAKYNKS
jgi:hypothetical protein